MSSNYTEQPRKIMEVGFRKCLLQSRNRQFRCADSKENYFEGNCNDDAENNHQLFNLFFTLGEGFIGKNSVLAKRLNVAGSISNQLITTLKRIICCCHLGARRTCKRIRPYPFTLGWLDRETGAWIQVPHARNRKPLLCLETRYREFLPHCSFTRLLTSFATESPRDTSVFRWSYFPVLKVLITFPRSPWGWGGLNSMNGHSTS